MEQEDDIQRVDFHPRPPAPSFRSASPRRRLNRIRARRASGAAEPAGPKALLMFSCETFCIAQNTHTAFTASFVCPASPRRGRAGRLLRFSTIYHFVLFRDLGEEDQGRP
ncbi:hypothetical protein EYF80_063774 [Liparis tanakae]|uniref:Uncharacterized protein n=1 Tax=Liparis tanakae TaxID=230148 RepID=A0A4Z2EBZ0_9TELE|nr:hypothetical protein EYF80_063774 [Liparis tanakae]